MVQTSIPSTNVASRPCIARVVCNLKRNSTSMALNSNNLSGTLLFPEIDMPLFDGLYRPASTPDSFLYDPNIDITKVTILFAQFAHTRTVLRLASGSFPYPFWAKNAPIYLFLLQCYHPRSLSVLREREALGISISSAMSYPTRTSSSFLLAGLMARPILHPHTSLSRCMQRRAITMSFQTIEELIIVT